jgi:hypothetical protein
MRLLDEEVELLDVLGRPPRDEGVRTDKDDTNEDAGEEIAVARACLGT